MHNRNLASLLSFVAGNVNIVGFLSIQRLTTNVTGHFAYVIDEVFRLQALKATIYFLYVFFFFLGSFVSSFLIEWSSAAKTNSNYTFSIFLECAIILALAFTGDWLIRENSDLLAFSLLFAMGLQNSLVTTISSAEVRTTHLTGLFTDLGIEASKLFFHIREDQKPRLLESIKLRLTIIGCFFIGGIIGGVAYQQLHLQTLIIAGAMLSASALYDPIKLHLFRLKRKKKGHRINSV